MSSLAAFASRVRNLGQLFLSARSRRLGSCLKGDQEQRLTKGDTALCRCPSPEKARLQSPTDLRDVMALTIFAPSL